MFQKLRTVIYHVEDLNAAKAWYTKLLGFGPYFDPPFYVGFDVAGFELGLDPNMRLVTRGAGGVDAYWSVKDIAATHAALLAMGATAFTPIQDVGEGIHVATVKDPWGNVVGIIEEKLKI